VKAPNVPPDVSLSASATSLTAPATVTLNATARDSDGTVAKVDFYNASRLVGTSTNSPYSMTMSALPAGSYTFTAVARDNSGALTTSSSVSVIVSNPLPVVTIACIDSRTSEHWHGPATWEVTRTGDTSTPLTVNYSFSGTGTYGVDYNIASDQSAGNITIPAGAASTFISVRAVSDDVNDPDETIIVTLNPNAAYNVGVNNSDLAYIREDLSAGQ
jgi:hypothetical protein